ncbi:cytochrome C oxidase subunit II [Taibaiella sp. KBW10]|uniref:cytochrome c oxidase subunit II n=1 Tax=Taibaiella sp. KBW10 TaxID=2153357 RepID=UPI000F5ABBCF|nr:cytochrome c oxidase subunit II [Taibaiella sp. KBW10]RQO30171.1 cytochrome C oxidase subunit II [Taibaiella sp. KBW10]
MSGLILTALVILVFIIIYQIAKASEYANIIRGEEMVAKSTNKLMAGLLVAFFVLGIYGIYKCHMYLAPLYLPESASEQGLEYEFMMKVTLWITGAVFFVTQAVLFWFSWKYQARDDRKPFFYSHNNKLEILWTTIPALTLMVLVAIGLKNWVTITDKAPADSLKVQVMGKQFNWVIRYPGKDGVFGKTNFRLINDANNIMGLDWNDPASKDDIIIENGEAHIINKRHVQFIINSRDVIHDVGLPHFRMKMDAVPGITTTLWFTPRLTTAEMKTITGNKDFVYEITCDQMCGKGHYSMRGTVVVETEADFKKWIGEQKSYYDIQNPPAAPVATTAAKDSTAAPAAAKDTVKTVASK